MQVSTLIIIMTALQLGSSLTCLIYNIASRRTIASFYHFQSSSSQYFINKYQKNEWQIYAIQFGWYVVVIFAQALIIILFLNQRKASRQLETLSESSLSFNWRYIFLAVGAIGQTVVLGFSLQAVLQIGYENGTNIGDFLMIWLQSVTFVLLLITISIYLYNFQSLQETTKQFATEQKRKDLQDYHSQGMKIQIQNKHHSILNGQKGVQTPNAAKINSLKPDYHEHTSPMGQHFQNLIQVIRPEPGQCSIKSPLLQRQPSKENPDDEQHSTPITLEKSSRKMKVHVPKLKLDQMKKEKANKQPLFFLNNLQISAIKPNRSSKNGQTRQEQISISDSDISKDLETIKKEAIVFSKHI